MSPVEEALKAVKNGEIIIVVDSEDRENEGDLICAAQHITPEKVNFMMKEARGLICVPISGTLADQLNLPLMVNENHEFTNCNFTVSVDAKAKTTTGISASDRCQTIRTIVDIKTEPGDLVKPGHIFPIRAKEGGVLVRAGHTEAAIDLVKLAGLKPAAAICEIINDNGEMARNEDLKKFAKKHNLQMISIEQLIEHRRQSEQLIEKVAESDMPTEFGTFKLSIYKDLVNKKEHLVLQKGEINSDVETLVRVHSECMTGDVFHSIRCDCHSQLLASLELIEKEGTGVVLYLRHEGRGIGLVNKIKAYNLQDQGLDTVEANEELGFKADLREYGIGAQILADLGLKKIKLLTNNPKKVVGLNGYGLEITDRISIESSPHERNKSYLKTKKDKLGHILKNV